MTCDRRFTLIDGTVVTDHAGVMYADQAYLQAFPEDAAHGIERIVATISREDLIGSEFYLNSWV